MDTKSITEFTDIKLNFGLVVRGDVEALKTLKNILAPSLEKLKIEPIYQKYSPVKLVISEVIGGGSND